MEKIIMEALSFAANKHRHQKRFSAREDTIPYLNHPIAVTHILNVEAGIEDADVLAASLLHDTIEDTETTYDELVKKFGKKIADIVVELTDDQSLSLADRYALQQEKTKNFSYEAKLVKMADKIANLRDSISGPPPSWSKERRIGHYRQAKKMRDALAGTHPKLEEIFDTDYATISGAI